MKNENDTEQQNPDPEAPALMVSHSSHQLQPEADIDQAQRTQTAALIRGLGSFAPGATVAIGTTSSFANRKGPRSDPPGKPLAVKILLRFLDILI
jgi:hypothetical protein